jgi:hypothetical protein
MKCENCSEEFTPNNKNYTKHVQRFCSTRCRNTFHRNNNELVSLGSLFNIPAQSVVEVNIQRVFIDLVCRGFHVFRSIPSLESCELLILFPEDTNYMTIKVVSASTRGDKIYISHRHYKYSHTLAICTPDKIIYDPELPESYIVSSSVDDVPETSA